MLRSRAILREAGVEIADVLCTHSRGKGLDHELASCHAIVLVRRGCFVRSADGRETLLDPTLAYCMSPGEEQRYDHPHDGGDACTSFVLDAALLASLWGGDPQLPNRPLPVAPALDLEHRLLLAAARRLQDHHALVERAISLTATALRQVDPQRVDSGLPTAPRARQALAEGVREMLAHPAERERSLPALARSLAVSPHHLSRVFRELNGHTISRHRMRLRARDALERIAGGESNLARLAADLGFADQSHLTRVIGSETGMTPSALRRMLV